MKSNDATVVISNERKECYSLILAFTLNVVLCIRCCILKVENFEFRIWWKIIK